MEKAKGSLSALKEDPGNDVKLKLYGFYKQVHWPIAALWRSSIPIPQATVGVCNTEKPGTFDFVGRAKWSAWNSLGNLSKVNICLLHSTLFRCFLVSDLVGGK